MRHIAIEGMDGVGKTTICRLLAKRLNYEFVEKPLHYLFDEDQSNWSNYFMIRDQVNQSENRNFTAWFYGLGNIYLYERFKNINIVTDRHLASNYCWSGTENNDDIYDLLIKKIGRPSLTVILYANRKVLKQRLTERNKCDKDIKKIGKTDWLYERMIHFCEIKKMPYIVIDTSTYNPEHIVSIILKKVGEIDVEN